MPSPHNKLVDKERRPRTPTVRTGGGGLHIYFKLPADLRLQSRNGIMPGLEIKAERGSVGKRGKSDARLSGGRKRYRRLGHQQGGPTHAGSLQGSQ